MSSSWHFDTQALHTGVEASSFQENSEALYLTSGYVQPNAQTAADRFSGEQDGYTYSRYGNPTVSTFEKRLAALENAPACVATASGMSAILMMCLGLLQAGDHIIASRSVFGATIRLLETDLAKFGISTTWVEHTDLQAWKNALQAQTRLFFLETPSNPLLSLCPIAPLADLAHEAGAYLAVDNCLATPILQRPLDHGADIVIHSGTKFLDGQGRIMAGALCASESLIQETFLPILRTAGMTLSAFNAWVLLKGLETLAIRVRTQSQKALVIAQHLALHPQVQTVYYPGLASHPQHALTLTQMSGQGGAVVAFEVKQDGPSEKKRERAFAVLDRLTMIRLCTNLGDTKTLAAHPASTSHGRLSEEKRQEAGITQGLIRLSVGLEHENDLLADLDQALS